MLHIKFSVFVFVDVNCLVIKKLTNTMNREKTQFEATVAEKEGVIAEKEDVISEKENALADAKSTIDTKVEALNAQDCNISLLFNIHKKIYMVSQNIILYKDYDHITDFCHLFFSQRIYCCFFNKKNFFEFFC
jgi:hypothetical protein